MKIYTRAGDGGLTGLYGGDRVSKASVRLHAYGTIDELNACLGIVGGERQIPSPLPEQLVEVQRLLFVVGADLATPMERAVHIIRINPENTQRLETWIDAMESLLPPLTQFILPSGVRAATLLHHARTTCRRAERWIVELSEHEHINPSVLTFTNRLSDYLFVAARTVNLAGGAMEMPVKQEESASRRNSSKEHSETSPTPPR